MMFYTEGPRGERYQPPTAQQQYHPAAANPSTHMQQQQLSQLTGSYDNLQPSAQSPYAGGGGGDVRLMYPPPHHQENDIKSMHNVR